MNRIAVIITILLISPAALAPAQSLFEPKRDPYRNLFGPPARVQSVRPTPQPPLRSSPQKPKVVCGMIIVPADPSVDPKIVAKLPDNTQGFTMRRVTPPVCTPE